MKSFLESLGALLILISVAGCGPNARYCSNCETAVTQTGSDGRARLIRGRCRVNGMDIDCTHEHSLCPECRQQK